VVNGIRRVCTLKSASGPMDTFDHWAITEWAENAKLWLKRNGKLEPCHQ
jgi:hypothetical protein